MKIVGRKKAMIVTLDSARGFLKLINTLRQGKPFLPKGVHRFKTFEESEEWSIKMMARNYNPDHLKPKTS